MRSLTEPENIHGEHEWLGCRSLDECKELFVHSPTRRISSNTPSKTLSQEETEGSQAASLAFLTRAISSTEETPGKGCWSLSVPAAARSHT